MSKVTTFFKMSIISATLFLGGCATTQQHQSDVNDPLEGYNRVMYSFNDTLDSSILKPVAQGYDAVMPDPINKSISSFFSNLDDITVIINDVLQFKFMQALHDTRRFTINTTVGVLGLRDVASEFGFKKNNEDFGQTLGVWGIGTGPYIVLPLLGPSDIRDTVGLIGDTYSDPIFYVKGPDARNPFVITDVIDTRAGLLSAEKVVDEAAFDEYTFVRDAYLQHRKSLVYDGNPPDDFDVFEE